MKFVKSFARWQHLAASKDVWTPIVIHHVIHNSTEVLKVQCRPVNRIQNVPLSNDADSYVLWLILYETFCIMH